VREARDAAEGRAEPRDAPDVRDRGEDRPPPQAPAGPGPGSATERGSGSP
jgi:hypothetical protein